MFYLKQPELKKKIIELIFSAHQLQNIQLQILLYLYYNA
jgi:hypothetical protein